MGDIYDAATYEPRRGIGHLMHRVRTEMLAAVDRELAADEELGPMEVTSAQFIIIATLSMGVAKSASDLCKGISYDAGAMTRMIDRLEEKGLLRRSRDPDDRRLVNLELTEKGSASLPRMRDVSMRVLNRFLQGFTKAEARQLEAYLIRMLENAPRGA
ncbi:MAG: MarR family winged helix-turn-helix transcriptional regulator [Steroidobacteraceae bacterium]|jgi:DNA-binding MarR family transcriptional regulator